MHPEVAGAPGAARLEQGLASTPRGSAGAECRGTFGPFFYLRFLSAIRGCALRRRVRAGPRAARATSGRVADAPQGAEQGGSVGSPGASTWSACRGSRRKATQPVTRDLLCAPVRQSATPYGVSSDPFRALARSTARWVVDVVVLMRGVEIGAAGGRYEGAGVTGRYVVGGRCCDTPGDGACTLGVAGRRTWLGGRPPVVRMRTTGRSTGGGLP